MVVDIGQQGNVNRTRFKGKLFGTSSDVRSIRMQSIDRRYLAHFARRLDTRDGCAEPLSEQNCEAPGTRADIKDPGHSTEIGFEGQTPHLLRMG